MDEKEQEIMNARHMAILLGQFQKFCDRLEGDYTYINKIRNILYNSSNKKQTIYNIFRNRFYFELEHEDEEYMLELVEAFLSKKSTRNPIPDEVRSELIEKQHGVCAFCGRPINEKSHVDHIVPFKYVGDELKNNYQVLCEKCNLQKSNSMDFQLKIFIK